MSTYIENVAAAARAVTFHSETTFSWFGSRSPEVVPEVRAALTARTARNFLLFNLQSTLYHNFYCMGSAQPAQGGVSGQGLGGHTPFAEELSAANSGHSHVDDGWTIRSLDPTTGAALAQKGGLELRVVSEEILPAAQLSDSGSLAGIRFPKGHFSLSPGFYVALSDRPFPLGANVLVRFYFNCNPQGAPLLVREMTTSLNAAGIAFNLKVLSDPNLYGRCDAGVLYVCKKDYAAVSAVVSRVYKDLLPFLGKVTPVFTKQLGPGLSLAEDPSSLRQESFGQHRCRLVAEGLLNAHEAGLYSVSERVEAVAARFAEDGICLDHPYLNPGSSDDYSPEPYRCPPAQTLQTNREQPGPAPGRDSYLQAATSIGRHLIAEAIRYDNMCNWVGAHLETDKRGGRSLVYRSLGPDLYGGTAGVALFLAELHSATHDTGFRQGATGAMRHALSLADSIPPSERLGLYSGWSGVALAALRVGDLLEEEEFVEGARKLAGRLLRDICLEQAEFDLLSGSAGAIIGALALGDRLADSSFLDFASRLAESLLRCAHRERAGRSWRSREHKQSPALTGLSHGAAGVGLALLELSARTHDPAHVQAARQAFEYERYCFDATEGNWLDLRGATRARDLAGAPRSFMVAWCHGAPGIALSRLRAFQILGDEAYRQEASIAIETTAGALRKAVDTDTRPYDFSLCHGQAGTAEILLMGEAVLGKAAAGYGALVFDVARMGIERYATAPRSWPSGLGAVETPGLMLGLAGTGYFYLRLHEPSVPSVLLWQPVDSSYCANP